MNRDLEWQRRYGENDTPWDTWQEWKGIWDEKGLGLVCWGKQKRHKN